MLTHKKKLFALTALSFCALTSAYADTFFSNMNAYTLNAKQELQRFDSMAVDDQGRILKTGMRAQLQKQFAKFEQVDLRGQTVLPGLIDAHGHILGLGINQSQLSLRATNSLAQAQAAITQYGKQFPKNQWILGGEWNQAIWKLGRFPTAAELDTALADRPVWLRRVDGHAGWANSKALQLAGISRDTLDPPGGKIERDAAGNPSGILVDNAMSLMEKKLPPLNIAEQRAALDAALQSLREFGLTSVHDAGVSASTDKLFREYAIYGKLTTRVVGMISGVDEFFDEVSKAGPLTSFADDRYSLRAVKLYADGALGSRGAALLQPYSDAPQTKGLLFVSDQTMLDMIRKAAIKGYQINVHAIGDAGNRQVIDSFAQLPKTVGPKILRHRIEHAQVLDQADIARVASLGLIPSMQPTHATSDMNMAEDRIGSERIAGAYAWRSFLKQGSRIACGSDFPIESANPFLGMHAAITRQDLNLKPEQGWHAEQAMTRLEAFRCFTLDAAYAGHQENLVGSLEKGKWADFIVIDRDFFQIPANEIHNIKVLQTFQAGQQVFGP